MKLLPKLALTTASIALTFAAINVKSANAALLTYSFSVNSPVGQGSGSFSFDDATFDNGPIPEAPIQSLNFTFNNSAIVYTEKDDLDYPTLGPVVFQNVAGSSPIGLSYLFQSKSNPSIDYEVNGFNFGVLGGQAFSNAVTYTAITSTPVPEPTTLGGTFLVCGIGLLLTRKAKSSMKVKA